MSAEREAYRELVAQIAAKAHTKLPGSAGRIDAAVKLVLLDEVTLLPDGTAQVGSCTDPSVTYTVNGRCSCRDYDQAPGNLCKHVLSVMVHKRVEELAPVVPEALPEAPASLNVKVLVQGHEVMVTLRGEAEAPLFDRLHTLLQRSDVQPLPKPAPKAGSWQRRR